MKYKVVLTGGEVLVITPEQKRNLEEAIKSSEAMVYVGNSLIRTNSIKGIFDISEDPVVKHGNDSIKKINEDFDLELKIRSRLPALEKAKLDFTKRLFPGWKLSGGAETDPEMIELKKTLVSFFTSDPQWPYAPSDIWWPIISQRTNKDSSKYFEFVFRHDKEVRRWMNQKLPS